MLIFSGIVSDTPYIYGYKLGIIDPATNPELEYQFQFSSSAFYHETIEATLPKIEGSVINEILNGEDTEISALTVTLFWNAAADTAATFVPRVAT